MKPEAQKIEPAPVVEEVVTALVTQLLDLEKATESEEEPEERDRFERDLKLFEERLARGTRTGRKLKPNVDEAWLKRLRVQT